MSGQDQVVTVFVNTVDSYSDCWDPFFTLLHEQWPQCPQPVVLNTTHRTFHHDRVDIVSVQGAERSRLRHELPWGERLARGLAAVDTEFVLYLVEDLFLEAPVRTDVIDRVLRQMQDHHLGCVRLAEPDGAGPWDPSPHEGLWEVRQDARYLLHLGPAIWRTDLLRSLVVAHEDPWQFEILGSERARQQELAVHCLDRDRYWTDPATRVMPYHPATGVTRGRWREDVVVDLFTAHGIEVDLSRMGTLAGEPEASSRREHVIDAIRRKARMLRWHLLDRHVLRREESSVGTPGTGR